jgi:localization factor PodJL
VAGGSPPTLVAPSQSGSASLAPPSTPPGGFIDTPRPSIAPGGFATAPTATPDAAVQPVRIAAPPPSLGADPIITGGIQKAPDDQGGTATLEPPEAIGSSALRKAAAAGDVKAQFEVGMRYAEGRGVIADPKEATVWYQRAADRGFPPAQYRLGSAYEKGHTGSRDPIQARRWYLSAAEKGNVRAMHNLGVLFANDRDMANAVPWFQKAAEYGLRDSQFNLGIIYALGSGVKQDLAVSYKWFGLAALQGDKDAEKKRDEVAGHLDKSNLAAAKAAVEVFRARPADKTANEEATVWIEPGASQAGLGPADTIQRVQALLQSRGLYGGAITGTLDDKTRQAVRTQQRKLNMKPTGEPDEAFLRALQGNAT